MLKYRHIVCNGEMLRPTSIMHFRILNFSLTSYACLFRPFRSSCQHVHGAFNEFWNVQQQDFTYYISCINFMYENLCYNSQLCSCILQFKKITVRNNMYANFQWKLSYECLYSWVWKLWKICYSVIFKIVVEWNTGNKMNMKLNFKCPFPIWPLKIIARAS